MPCRGCQDRQVLQELNVEELVAEQLLLEPDQVSPAVRDKRLAICKNCPMLFEHTCLKCGCFVQFRASLMKKQCPLKKW